MILIVHTIASTVALLCGAFILLTPQGTATHRKLGYCYAVNMLILLVTSFFMFDMWGEFGVYHALSIVSFVTLLIALYFPLFGRKGEKWIEHHLIWMGYSYIGLVMAGGSHLFSVFPSWPVYLRMFLFWGLPYALGSVLIFTRKKRSVNAAKANMKDRK